MSSGQGLALGIKNLPNGKTLGDYGTNGSFGLAGDAAVMPGGIEIKWPYGRSLDKNKRIQVDSNGNSGGVTPTVLVPVNQENRLRAIRGEDVELEQAVRLISSSASFSGE